MTIQTTQSLAAFSAPATSSDISVGLEEAARAPQTVPSSPDVVNIFRNVVSDAPVPPRHVSLDSLVDRASADPKRRAALEEARGWLADTEYAAEGDTVRTLRLRKGYSQVQLAAKIGTSQPHIARIERGTENITIDTCRRLVGALGIDMNTLDDALRRQESVARAPASSP